MAFCCCCCSSSSSLLSQPLKLRSFFLKPQKRIAQQTISPHNCSNCRNTISAAARKNSMWKRRAYKLGKNVPGCERQASRLHTPPLSLLKKTAQPVRKSVPSALLALITDECSGSSRESRKTSSVLGLGLSRLEMHFILSRFSFRNVPNFCFPNLGWETIITHRPPSTPNPHQAL
jgi:hypothetical protein